MKRLLQSLMLAAVLVAGASAVRAQEHGQDPHAAPAGEAAGHGEAAEHGGAHIDPKTLGLQLFNFGVLLFLLIKFGGGAINKGLKARHEQLKADMEEATRLRAAAELRFKEQEKRLANLESELETMRAAIVKEAAAEKARIIAAAEEKSRRVQDETKFLLDQQVKEAEQRFRGEVAAAALRIADDLLRRSVATSDEQRLIQTFVGELTAARPQERT
jgi:F-type H+-transporting ATPase subunit b